MTGTEVADGVVVVTIPMSPGLSTAAVVLSGDRTVLVDTGTATSGPELIDTCVAHRGLPPVTTIMCTHFHHDHTGGLAQLSRDAHVTVHAHVAESGLVADPRGFTTAMSGLGIDLTPPVSIGTRVRPVLDGFRIPAGGRTWEVVHVPGHTWGHVALWSQTERMLIAGDAVQGPGVPFTGTLGQGTGLPYYLDVAAYRSSLERMRRLEPRTLVLAHENPAWGTGIIEGAAAVEEALLSSARQVEAVHGWVLDALGTRPRPVHEVTADACSAGRIGRAAPQAELTVRAHLALLRTKGIARLGPGGWALAPAPTSPDGEASDGPQSFE